MLNLAILSKWHIHADNIAHQVTSIPGVNIKAVWDEEEKRGRSWAMELGAEYYENLDSLMEVKDIQGVIITAATNKHKELIIKSAKAGKHIFTEKVLAPLKRDCEEIAEVVLSAGVKFGISLPKRGYPMNLFAKRIVEDGTIGEISLLRIRDANNGISAKWLPEDFYNPECCSGGAMIDLGAHGLHLANWLLGQPKSIISMFNSFSCLQVEDNAVSVMEFNNKALAVIETGYVSCHSPYSLEMYGTEGSLLAGGPEGKAMLKFNAHAEVDEWNTISDLPKALPDPVNLWVEDILNNRDCSYGLKEAIELSEIVENAYNSYIQGKKIYFSS